MMCAWCQTYPVRGWKTQARYCSDECSSHARNHRKKKAKEVHVRYPRHLRPWTGKDFTPDQIEARYERARQAKRNRRAA